MKKIILLAMLALQFMPIALQAQDRDFARKTLNDLTSPAMYGRGYAFRGDSIAAAYIKQFYVENNVQPFFEDYYQRYTFPMNVMDGDMEVQINGLPMKYYDDYRVEFYSCDMHGTFEVLTFKAADLLSKSKIAKFKKKNDLKEKFVAIDISGLDAKTKKKDAKILAAARKYTRIANVFESKGLILVRDRLDAQGSSWGTIRKDWLQVNICKDMLNRDSVQKIENIFVAVDANWNPAYPTQNVVTTVKGTVAPDSFIVVGAHYDALGMIGRDHHYPGAADNGGGAVLIMDLARYFTQHPPKYTMLFITFSGEEAGLQGSEYFVDNIPIPLKKIKLMVNADMVASGEDGAGIAQAQCYPHYFEQLKRINDRNNYVTKFNDCGFSKASDHYPFHKKGIPNVYFVTHGPIGEYHSIYDTSANVSLVAYPGLFQLVVDFINEQ